MFDAHARVKVPAATREAVVAAFPLEKAQSRRARPSKHTQARYTIDRKFANVL